MNPFTGKFAECLTDKHGFLFEMNFIALNRTAVLLPDIFSPSMLPLAGYFFFFLS